MICTKKTAILTLSLATTWSVNALAVPPNSISEPPLEAYAACEGKQIGEQSSFVSEMGNTISGLCEQQHDGRLILKPNNLIRSNAIPPAAYEDCVGKKLGDAVQLTLPTGKTLSGTCQSDGDRLYFRLDSPPGMHTAMKTHTGSQHLELLNESKQHDAQQQAPEQKENDNSSGNQQQAPHQEQNDNMSQHSTAPPENPEDLHSDVEQQHQAAPPNVADKPEEQQSQPIQQPAQNPVQTPLEKSQERPKGFLGKIKDFFTNLW